jgi:uncharacterized membrane protein YedE/YeeE
MSELFFLWPLTGGLMIGLASGCYLLGAGRVAGISGFAATVSGLSDTKEETGVRLQAASFIVGMPLGAALAATLIREPQIVITTSPVLLVAGGLLVGFGTRLGSGCTSGHGISGLSRLSPRSILATLTFMVTAAITVFVTRHLLSGGAA